MLGLNTLIGAVAGLLARVGINQKPKPAHALLKPNTAFPETIEALRSSWAAVEGLGLEPVGVLFFKRIFEIAPGAVDLFSFKAIPQEARYVSPQVCKVAGRAVERICYQRERHHTNSRIPSGTWLSGGARFSKVAVVSV
jgi:hypothetical protein